MPAPAALLLTQAASVLAGALVFKALLDDTVMPAPPSSNSSRFRSSLTKPPCPTCNGTRRVPCFCSRWSDGDAGCRTCSGSGMALCNSCGGSGTARPIPVSLKSSSSNPRPR